MARKAADEREHHRDAGGGGNKVLHRQAQHLGQIGQRRLAGVGLPVGVGHKAGGGVERQMPAGAGRPGRIEGQKALQNIEQKQEHETERAEQHRRQCVLLPAHVLLGVNAAELVDAVLHRPQRAGEKGLFPSHHLVHIVTQGDCEGDEDRDIQDVL